jgi:hypothetical protein
MYSPCFVFPQYREPGSQVLSTFGVHPDLTCFKLGRRFPFEEILAKLASALNVSLED